MPTPQRLPIVNSDDGVWGDIIRQYLMKEHYNDDTDNAVNGGHQKITIRAGTTAAGTAPLKFTSSTSNLLTTPEAGAMEFDANTLYFTPNTTRKRVALYDGTGGATGDIYYRDSNGYFTSLGVGSTGDILTVASGIPSWTATIVGKSLDNTNTITVKDANLTIQNSSATTKQAKFDASAITAGQTRTYTLPDATTTIVGTDTTQVLTNKQLTSRAVSPSVAATYTIDVTATDIYVIGTQNANITNLTATGTAVEGQKLMIRIKSDGTARTIAWDSAKYVSSGIATLPSTTVASKTHHVGLIYDNVLGKFVCIAVDAIGY